jgi:PAS domain S-box-containing protein
LIVWSVGFWVISIGILAFVFLQIGQNQTLAETRKRNVQLASSISRDINTQISNIVGNARISSQHLQELGPNPDVQAEALLGLRLSSTRYSAIYYFDSNDKLVLHLTDSIQNLMAVRSPAEIASRPPMTVRNEIKDAYRRTKEKGIYISGVYHTPLDYTPVLCIGTQITFPTGEKRIVVYEIDLTDIWQGIDNATIGQTGFTYATSSDGIVIAHPEPAYVGRRVPAEIKPVLSGYEGSAQFVDPFTNREVVAAYSQVGGPTGWGIVVQQDRAEIYSAIVRTASTIFVILLVLGLIGTLGILLLIGSFTRPIKELTRTSQGIARTGNLTRAGMLQRSDELGQLSQAFDQMIDKVKDSEWKLTSSEERYRSLFEHANDAILLIEEGGIIDCNHKTEELFGAGRGQIIRRMPSDLSPKTQPDGMDSREKEQNLIGRALSGEAIRMEWQSQRFDGKPIDTEVAINRLIIDGRPVLMAIVRDITERKRAEGALAKAYDELENRVEERTTDLREANTLLRQEIAQRQQAEDLLQQSETKYRDLVENSASIILDMDPDANVTFLNKYGQEFFGYSEAEIVGRNVVGTIVPQIDSSGNDVESRIAEVVKNPGLYQNNENENMKSSGDRVWIAWTNKGIYDKDGKLLQIHSIGIDRTAQLKAAITLQEKAKEEAAAAERSRLARDLHDAVSQTLFSASLISEVLPRIWEKDQQEGRRRLEEVRQLTRGALAEMRTLLFELRPAALADAEFSYLLHQLAESVTGRTRMPVNVRIEGQCDFPAETKVALYRIAQEALNNVVKHAVASQANIEVSCQSDLTEVSISDNGRGFDMASVRPESLGLGIMRDRARGIGAELIVQSHVGAGSKISVKIRTTKEIKP